MAQMLSSPLPMHASPLPGSLVEEWCARECCRGGWGPKARELDDDALKNAVVVVESREAAIKESAEIIHSGAPIYAELGEVLAGKILELQGQTTVFKSLGIATEDVAAGSWSIGARWRHTST